MNMSMIDKSLVVLMVISAILATDGFSRADPPESECDQLCRERRFFKERSANGTYFCSIYKYRTCYSCRLIGLCYHNSNEDKLTTGTCVQVSINQEVPKSGFAIAECDAMCAFPQATGYAVREAVEQATTYSGVGAGNWIADDQMPVEKCLVQGQPFKSWTDEGEVMWKEKKKFD